MSRDITQPTSITWATDGGVSVTLDVEHGVRIDAPNRLSRHTLVKVQAFLDRVHTLMEEGGVIEIPKVDPLPVRPFSKSSAGGATHLNGHSLP